MAKTYRKNQRTEQNVPPQFIKKQNNQPQKTQSQKTQSLNIPTAKKLQDQNTQGQDTQNWNNDTNWIFKTPYHQKYAKNWMLSNHSIAILLRMLNCFASYYNLL